MKTKDRLYDCVRYEKSFFDSDELSYWADLFLYSLPENITMLVSTGSSGCSIASAMLAGSDRGLEHIYIRKQGEDSHGGYNRIFVESGKVAIVDDFITGGYTMRRVISKLKEENNWLEVIYVLVGHSNYKHNFQKEFSAEFGLEVILIEVEE